MLYTDPGSGILIWQLLLALFFGAAFYFTRLRQWASAKLRPAQNVQQSIHTADTNRELPGEGERRQ